MICPRCHGEKVEKLFSKDFPVISCAQCLGTGVVSILAPKWMINGEKLATYRRDNKLTLFKAAKWLGISCIKLSEMERGVIEPDMTISYLGLKIINK